VRQHPSRIDLPEKELIHAMPRFWSVISGRIRRVFATRGVVPRLLMWSLPAVVIGTPGWWSSRRLQASDVDTRRATPDSPILRETRLTLKARQALFEDPLLVPYNLCVIVHGDVATLRGTLPKTALALRAQERLRNLSFFKEVRSELIIDPNCNLPTELPVSSFSTSEPPGGKPRPSGALTGRGGTPEQIPVMKINVPQDNSDGAPNPPAIDPDAAAQEKPPLNDAVSLLPPRPIPETKNDPADPPANILPPRPLPDAKDPAAAVEQLRRSEARFQSLQVTVRDGVVTIRGSGDDLFAFAQTVRRIPGVVRVVVDPR
jgi:hypothetical protein